MGSQYIHDALDVIEIEAQALLALKNKLNDNFTRCCELILQCTGRVIVTGMGKSGHIGAKIAATLASTGTPSFYVHPAEASHGDLGMITSSDIVFLISNSGNTQELLALLPVIKRLGIPFIALTGNSQSILAQEAWVHLEVSIAREACPLNLAPTTSTTAALVMGDALAVALLNARQFNEEDFARTHPGGILGKCLTLTVLDIAHTKNKLPLVNEQQSIANVLVEITTKQLGIACIVDSNGYLLGVFTDGDVRRTLTKSCDIYTIMVKEVMTRECITVSPDTKAVAALQLMQQLSITSLVITDAKRRVLGVVSIHDILRAGVMLDTSEISNVNAYQEVRAVFDNSDYPVSLVS